MRQKITGLLLVLGFAMGARAQSVDHSMFPVLDGYQLLQDRGNYGVKAFDVYTSPRLKCKGQPCTDGEMGFSDKSMLSIEGKITQLGYRAVGGAVSRAAVIRNYEKAILEKGGQRISDAGYAVAFRLKNADQRVWVVLSFQDEFYNLDVIEQKAFVPTLTAKDMKSKIESQGRLAIEAHFETGSAVVQPPDFAVLDEAVSLLKSSPQWRLSIEGHTDNQGDAEANRTLSEARAQAIGGYFARKGIEPGRLQFKGFGSDKPVADNGTPEGRQKNRRVELVKFQ